MADKLPDVRLYHHSERLIQQLSAAPDKSIPQARMALFDYIEVFYNRERLHSGIDYARPASRAA
jgi:transposase InsO family protein